VVDRIPAASQRPGGSRAIVRIAGAAALTVLVAGCGFLNGPAPTPTPIATNSPGTSISLMTAVPVATPTPTPTPTPHLVTSIALIAPIGEPKEWTPAGLTWLGIGTVATRIGATTSLVEPASNADLEAAVETAAAADKAVVVTVGPDAAQIVQAAAGSHPGTQFIEIGVVVPDGSPTNVHGLAVDQAEAGYLAGYVAASFSTSGKIGMVGDTKTDARSANYSAGFTSGSAQAAQVVAVGIAYAGTADLPDKGRTAAVSLVKAGDDVILTMPGLAGIGAAREACTRKALLVAVEMDAWHVVPDLQRCLIASVVARYDVAVSGAVQSLSTGKALDRVTVEDVANGGLALSDFHANLPPGLQPKLAVVLAALQAGPPRATAAPPTPALSAAPSASPKP
jgi:basic membrane protein A and related proteins